MGSDDRYAAPWWLWVTATLLLALAFASTWRWLGVTWLGSPYYSHGFLVPLVSIGLAVLLERERRDRARTHAGPRSFWLGLVWVTASLAVHLAALRWQQSLISAVALVSAISGAVLALGGDALLRRQAFPLAFLAMMIPLPWLERITPPLSRWVAALVAAITRAAGLNVITSGARIELAGTALVIGAPCSGVNSLAALTTLAVLYAYLVRGPLAARLAVILLATPMALGANLLRVLLILALAHYGSVDLALGFFHDWSSPLLFLVACTTLFSIGRGLGCQGHRFDTLR